MNLLYNEIVDDAPDEDKIPPRIFNNNDEKNVNFTFFDKPTHRIYPLNNLSLNEMYDLYYSRGERENEKLFLLLLSPSIFFGSFLWFILEWDVIRI